MMIKQAALIGVVIASVFPSVARGGDEERDKKDVRHVFEQYLQSVKTADLAVASDIWSHGPDIIVVTPFGRFEGWDTVRDSLYVNFLQKAVVERDLQPSNVAIHVAGDAAWLVFDWTFTAKSRDGQAITSKGWESHVYRRTRKSWAIVQLHYSVPPPPPR